MWCSSSRSSSEPKRRKISTQKEFQRNLGVLFVQVILSAVKAEGDKPADLADTNCTVSWFPHHHWMYPLSTGHAQSVAKPCLRKIHFVLFQNTTSALTASNNHRAITPSWLRGEQDTKGLFVGGCVAFLSLLNRNVKFSVSLKPARGISCPFLGLSRVGGQLFVPGSSCHPAGFALLPAQSPAEDRDGMEEPGPTVWWLCWKCLWQNLPLELCWSCPRSRALGPPAPPVFSLYEGEAAE